MQTKQRRQPEQTECGELGTGGGTGPAVLTPGRCWDMIKKGREAEWKFLS